MFYLSTIFGGLMGLLGFYLGDKIYYRTPKKREISIEEQPIIKYGKHLYTIKEFEEKFQNHLTNN